MSKQTATLFTLGDAARTLGVSIGRIRQLETESRVVPVAVTPGGIGLYNPDAIQGLAKERAAARRAR